MSEILTKETMDLFALHGQKVAGIRNNMTIRDSHEALRAKIDERTKHLADTQHALETQSYKLNLAVKALEKIAERGKIGGGFDEADLGSVAKSTLAQIQVGKSEGTVND